MPELSPLAPDPDATIPPTPAAATLVPGDVGSGCDRPPARTGVAIPGYEVLGELGRGGMGVVYRARQVGLNRDVALKMVLAGGHSAAADLARFKAEAEAVAKLQHPNIVQAFEVGEAGGLPYLSLEFCPGGSLDRKLTGAPQPAREAAALAETLARAVRAAHLAGVVHRDLKPANVLLAADGTPKVTDFGLAKPVEGGSGLTRTGAIVGTPSYMAPEQADGSRDVGPPADVYALGAILYELLTGRRSAATPLDTVLQVVSADPVPPTRLNAHVPRDLETIALKCLAKEPAKRYADAAALADDLGRWQRGESIAARPAGATERAVKWAKRRPAVAGLSAAVVLAVAGGFAGITYQLGVATESRGRAEAQEKLATDRADALAREQARVRRELHQSDLLRADLLLQGREFVRAEGLLWRTHLTRPDDGDRRPFWRLWDLYSQRPRRSGWSLEPCEGVALAPDGGRLATVFGSRVTIHGAATGAFRSEFTTPQTNTFRITFSPDARRLGLISADGSVTVWDLGPSPKLRLNCQPAAAPPLIDPLTALGSVIFGQSLDETRRLQKQSFLGKTQVCFLHGDRVLVTDPATATVWGLNSQAIDHRFKLEPLDELGRTNPFPDGAAVPAGPSGDLIPVLRAGAVQLWELPRTPGGSIRRTQLDFTGTSFRRAPVSGGPAVAATGDTATWGAVLSPDGRWLVTSGERHVRVWDVESGEKRGEVEIAPVTRVSPAVQGIVSDLRSKPDVIKVEVRNWPGDLAVTPDGATVRTIDSEAIRHWRLPDLTPVRTIPHLGFNPRFAALTADGRRTYAVEGATVAAYDHQPAEVIHPLRSPDPGELRSEWSTALAAAGPVISRKHDGIEVWVDGKADRISVSQGLMQDKESGVAIAATGRTAVSWRTGPFSTSVTRYDLVTKRITGSFALVDPDRGAVRMANRTAVSPDGRTLVTETQHGLLVADLTTARVARVFRDAPGLRWSGTVFTPDSRAVVCGNGDALLLMDLADGRVLARGIGGYPLTFTGAVTGPGGLTKAGDFELILAGPLSYAGPTTVSGGRLTYSDSPSQRATS